jgi:hypothetical protein
MIMEKVNIIQREIVHGNTFSDGTIDNSRGSSHPFAVAIPWASMCVTLFWLPGDSMR